MQRWNDLAIALLAQAEAHFGPRDIAWTFGGVTFIQNGPQMLNDAATMNARIGIDTAAEPYEDQIIYQLSHEVIHLLSPVPSTTTTLIEEGVAVFFSLQAPEYIDKHYRLYAWQYLDECIKAKNYRDALYAYLELRKIDGGAVRRLRAVNPEMRSWDAEFLKQNVAGMSDDLANLLTQQRKMR